MAAQGSDVPTLLRLGRVRTPIAERVKAAWKIGERKLNASPALFF
jgi:hypothetical protein